VVYFFLNSAVLKSRLGVWLILIVSLKCLFSVIQFEVRGGEPMEYDIRAGWNAKSSLSNATFPSLEFEEGSWEDYDETAVQPVGVYDVFTRFVKL